MPLPISALASLASRSCRWHFTLTFSTAVFCFRIVQSYASPLDRKMILFSDALYVLLTMQVLIVYQLQASGLRLTFRKERGIKLPHTQTNRKQTLMTSARCDSLDGSIIKRAFFHPTASLLHALWRDEVVLRFASPGPSFSCAFHLMLINRLPTSSSRPPKTF